MTMIKNKKIIYPVIAGVLACLVVFAGWFIVQEKAAQPQQLATVDMPVYHSVGELTAASDVVVIGTVKDVVNHVIDYGQDGKSEEVNDEGIPAVLYEVEVTEDLKGKTDSTIFVYSIDAEKIHGESISVLQDNEKLVLFLAERASKDWPNVPSPSDKFYVMTSFDNGVFDILANGSVKPRMPEAFAVHSPNGTVIEEPEFNLEEVCAAIQTAS